MDENGWFCGGAHPDSSSIPLLFDLQTGKEVDLLTWLNAKAVKRERVGNDTLSSLQPAFRNLILGGWKSDEEECGDAVRGDDYWSAELTRTGIVFTPQLPHAAQACSEDFPMPFAKLASYLTPEGKKNVAALQAEAVSRR